MLRWGRRFRLLSTLAFAQRSEPETGYGGAGEQSPLRLARILSSYRWTPDPLVGWLGPTPAQRSSTPASSAIPSGLVR